MAAVAVPAMAMGNALDGLNASSSSLTARRQASANLPTFELPPPQVFTPQYGANTAPKQPSHPHSNPGSVPSLPSAVSVNNLLTPPSNTTSDSTTPNSSGLASASTSNAGILPYTPYWNNPSSASFHAGYAPQPWQPSSSSFGSRSSVFSPSLGQLVRSTTSPTTGESPSLPPPPPYDMGPLPAFPHPLSMPAPPVPTSASQQQTLAGSLPTQLSPVPAGDAGNPKAPPTPTLFHNSQASSAPPPGSYPSYPGPSPVQQSPHSAGGSLSASSPLGQPPLGHDANHHGVFSRPPYPSYSLPPMPGPVVTNVNNPGSQMTMMGGMPPNAIPHGYNSGYAASSQGGYGAPAAQPSQPAANDRPFKCDQCPQSFNRNHDLKRHKKIHLAVKPFPCHHCDKSFSRKDALKVGPSGTGFPPPPTG